MTTYSWQNAVSGNWGTATDWQPTGPVNGASADAVIGVAGTYVVNIASNQSFLVDSLTFGPGAGGTLAVAGTLTLGGTLAEMTINVGTVNLTGTIAGGTVNLDGGVLNDTGGAITAPSAWTAARWTFPAARR